MLTRHIASVAPVLATPGGPELMAPTTSMEAGSAGPRVVAEVASYEHSRRFGESKLNTFRDGWRVLRAIMRERRRLAPAPMHFPLVGVAELSAGSVEQL